MKITTKYNSDYEYTSTTEEGQTVKIDMKDDGKEHMGPMQLVASALSGCVAVEVASMIKKKRKTINDLTIEVTGKRQPTPPKYFTDLHMVFTLHSPDASVIDLEKVVKLSVEKYCSVGSSLKANITHESIVVKD